MFKWLWCLTAHRKHRYRTGEVVHAGDDAYYAVKCRKCGNEDIEELK